jgi:hypothetical protein
MESISKEEITKILDNEQLTKDEKFKQLKDMFETHDLSKSHSYNKARALVDPEFKKSWRQSMYRYFNNRLKNDEEFRKRIYKMINDYTRKRYNEDEEFREKMKEYSRNRYHNNEAYRERKKQLAIQKYRDTSVEKELKATIVIREDGTKRYIYDDEETRRKQRERSRQRYHMQKLEKLKAASEETDAS